MNAELRRLRSRPGNVLFNEVFFPTAQFLCGEEVRMIAAIARGVVSARRFVNLLPYPWLSGFDWRSTVSAFLWAADEHGLFLS